MTAPDEVLVQFRQPWVDDCKFATHAEAEAYVLEERVRHPHLEHRIVRRAEPVRFPTAASGPLNADRLRNNQWGGEPVYREQDQPSMAASGSAPERAGSFYGFPFKCVATFEEFMATAKHGDVFVSGDGWLQYFSTPPSASRARSENAAGNSGQAGAPDLPDKLEHTTPGSGAAAPGTTTSPAAAVPGSAVEALIEQTPHSQGCRNAAAQAGDTACRCIVSRARADIQALRTALDDERRYAKDSEVGNQTISKVAQDQRSELIALRADLASLRAVQAQAAADREAIFGTVYGWRDGKPLGDHGQGIAVPVCEMRDERDAALARAEAAERRLEWLEANSVTEGEVSHALDKAPGSMWDRRAVMAMFMGIVDRARAQKAPAK